MQDFNAKHQSLLREAMRNGNIDFEPETLPDLYSTDESYPDKMLFSKLYTAIAAAEEYPEQLEKVIERAKLNLDAFSDMGIGEDSFTYKYQLKVIELYEKMQSSVELEVEYTRGWNEYFAYDTVNIFIFTMLIMLGSLIFVQEKQSGFIPIMRTAKNGRDKTFRAKLISSEMIAVILALLTGGADLAVIILGYDLPAVNAPLMSMEMFSSVSSGITVIGYFAVFSTMHIAGALLMAMLVCALSEFLAKYIPILGTAVILTLLPALCAYFGLAAAENVNFLNLLAGTPLFLQSASMSMLGNEYAMLIL